MISLFKKYFIPHKKNDHRPHLLRTEATTFLLVSILLGELAFLGATLTTPQFTSFLSSIIPSALIDSANAARSGSNLPSLAANSVLQEAAQLKANDMAQKGYFAHTSPEGVTPWHWFEVAGYKYAAAGENLAVNFVDSNDVHVAWMNSATHKANIINPTYSEIGIASAVGMYKGRDAIFVVQLFGKPKVAPSVQNSSVATITPRFVPKKSLPVPVKPSSLVLGSQNEPTFVAEVMASPRLWTSRVFSIFGFAIALALVSTLAITFGRHDYGMILRGVLVLAFVGSMLLVNNQVAHVYSAIF
jgi:hypothetical protein